MNAESADSAEKVTSVVIEEIDVLPKSEPIRNLEIVRTMQYGEWNGAADPSNKSQLKMECVTSSHCIKYDSQINRKMAATTMAN